MCLAKLDQLNIRERIHIAFKCTQNIHKCGLHIRPQRKPQNIPENLEQGDTMFSDPM